MPPIHPTRSLVTKRRVCIGVAARISSKTKGSHPPLIDWERDHPSLHCRDQVTRTSRDWPVRPALLYLSGTPFRRLGTEDAIFNWTYIDERHRSGTTPTTTLRIPILLRHAEEIRRGRRFSGFSLSEFQRPRSDDGGFVFERIEDRGVSAAEIIGKSKLPSPETIPLRTLGNAIKRSVCMNNVAYCTGNMRDSPVLLPDSRSMIAAQQQELAGHVPVGQRRKSCKATASARSPLSIDKLTSVTVTPEMGAHPHAALDPEA